MNKEKNGSRIFWGIILIAAAVILVFGKLDYFGGFHIFTLIATVILLAIFIRGISRINFGTIFFSVAFLAMLYAEPLHIEKLVPWTLLLVALLASTGFQLLFHDASWRRKRRAHHDFSNVDREIIDEIDGEVITQKAVLGGVTKYINSENLKEVDLECSFAGMQIFFDGAQVPEGHAVIRIHATCSGVELYVPKSWQVENHLDAMLSGVDYKNKNQPDGNVIVDLIGDISFSGIEITYI